MGAACSDSSGPGTGQVSLLLKDAPGDVLAAVVTIDEIDLQGSGGTTVLLNTPVTTNLLTLSTDAATLVQQATVPAGTYGQLRFVISGGYLEVDNGNGTSSIYASSPTYTGLPPGAAVSGTLDMPSYLQSGLKITLPGGSLTVTDGGEQVLLVDFDVAQSFGHSAGSTGSWVMHPVIQAEQVGATGSARVTLTPDAGVNLPLVNGMPVTLGEFTATLTGSDGVNRTVALTDQDQDGTFEADFHYLTPGDYTLVFTAPAGVTAFSADPPVPATVTITAGASTTTAFLLTGAS